MTEVAATRPRASEHAAERLVTWARLSFAMQRWELLLVTAGTALLAGAMLWIAWQTRAVIALDPACFGPNATGGSACEALGRRFGDLATFGTRLGYVSFLAPFGIGLIVGVPLVSREVDHGTASLGWTLARSRSRWMLRRVLFAVLVVIGLLAVLAVVSDVLAQSIAPGRDMSLDFTGYGRRGALLDMRALLALAIGLTAGAMVGRQLPALLVAIFGAVLLFTAVSLAMDRWFEVDAVATPYGQETPAGGRQLGERMQLTDGTRVTWGELSGRYDTIAIQNDGTVYTQVDDQGNVSNPVGRMFEVDVPGELYPTFIVRESGVLGAATLLVGGLAFVVVRRRRPY
jgi:hypothetical protein